jgi:dihydropteroate synthase
MAIVNLTPDSFYDGGRLRDEGSLMRQIELQLDEGADILDIGAASSRPGAKEVPLEEEWNRMAEALKLIRYGFPDMPISIDTWRAEVARRALEEGAHMINDISAGQLDAKMWDIVAQARVPYVMMHMQGSPQSMQKSPSYNHVVDDQLLWFAEKLTSLKSLGLNDIILDPGFGFGKTVEHNYHILKELDRYHLTGHPILVGLSRKSMICRVLELSPEEALNGTTALHSLAVLKGAHILRVHDVKEAAQVIRLMEEYKKAGNGDI